MADNILTKDRAAANLDIAAKEIGAVKFPRNILTDSAGADIDPATAAGQTAIAAAVATLLTDTQMRATPLAVAGIRRDADTAYVSDGGVHPMMFNDGGRLKVSTTPADIASTTGSIIVNGGIVALQVKRLSNVSVSMVATSLVGHNVSFEASNNSTNGTDGNWYGVQVVRSNANTVETASGVLAATPAYMWQVNVSDYAWFRVRATAHTSGTAAYIMNPSSYVSEPIPAIQVSATQPVSGSLTSAGTTTNTPVTPTTTFTNSAATTNATVIKGSAGTVWSINVSNTNAAARFLKFYNKATAPTVGTDVPVLTIPIPAGAVVTISGGSNGIRFATGIGIAITASAADSDTTVVAASEIKVATSFT